MRSWAEPTVLLPRYHLAAGVPSALVVDLLHPRAEVLELRQHQRVLEDGPEQDDAVVHHPVQSPQVQLQVLHGGAALALRRVDLQQVGHEAGQPRVRARPHPGGLDGREQAPRVDALAALRPVGLEDAPGHPTALRGGRKAVGAKQIIIR